MTLIVLPLSELHAAGPYKLYDLIQGLLVHMVVIGLPISFSVRRFIRRSPVAASTRLTSLGAAVTAD